MKTKTDLYTKIVLTVIAIFLGVIIVKDMDLVSKAHAGELDLSNVKIEKAADADDGEITFFIYENSKIKEPFSKENYRECGLSDKDVPTYIITNKKIYQKYHPSYQNVETITKIIPRQ